MSVRNQRGENPSQDGASAIKKKVAAIKTDVDGGECDSPIIEELVSVVGQLVDRVETLEDENDELRDELEEANKQRKKLFSRIYHVEEDNEETRDIARSAVAKVNQTVSPASPGDSLPGGVEPASSELDFFANVRDASLRDHFVVEKNERNSYRAVQVAKRWDEFANKGRETIHFDRESVADALTAIDGQKPHRQTITRVMDRLEELGGADLGWGHIFIGRSRENGKREVLKMSRETAERLEERRYHELDLVDEFASGVTPVVTNPDRVAV